MPSPRPGRLRTAVIVALALGCVLFALLPLHDLGGQVLYDVVAGSAVVAGVIAVLTRRLERPGAWLLVLGGMGIWVVGDIVWSIEQYALHRDTFPAPSDAIYVTGYGVLVAGAVMMVRTRRAGRDTTALLDSLIVAAGVAVIVTTFVIAPLAQDSTLSPAAKFVSSFYPIADLVLLAILARMWTIPGARTWSSLLLSASIGLTLAVDLVWNIWIIASDSSTGAASHVADTAWLAGYVLVAAAALVPSMDTMVEPLPDREESLPSSRRLIALGAGLMLPAVALLIDGTLGTVDDLWPVIGVGMLALTALILARMSGLLTIVQSQALRLSAVARSDALTGAPNRRTWDHELERACAASREADTTLCVAMMDLDSFKAFNDTNGHQAGDLLLREAVASWSDAIGTDGMLARYGGEEFAILLPGMTLTEATQRIRGLQELTPSGQTFSAGVSRWDPATEPSTAVAWADDALYQAKRTGRHRVVTHGGADSMKTQGRSELPAFTLVLQPIIELGSGMVVGHEALSRFHGTDDDVERVYRRAHAHGYGDLLEVSAIVAAVSIPERPIDQLLYVNASPTALASERFWADVPASLVGIVVELSEMNDGVDEDVLAEAVERLRSRGALIALDDIGSLDGSREFARLAALRPDIVKIDRSVVAGCATDPRRSAICSALSVYARAVGAITCAEGVDDVADLRHLTGLGITHVQGYLLAMPDAHWRTRIDLPFEAVSAARGNRI